MHPEVEGSIRENAKDLMSVVCYSPNEYFIAAENGLISFDEVYLHCLVESCFYQAYDEVNEVCDYLKELEMFVDASKLGYILLADYLSVNVEEVKHIVRSIDDRLDYEHLEF